ncbi:CDP-diacylglycerol--glycerol-3-phosphate 3-phosphatidyltransferase [Bathycoccus prasinos]|uniref:CDP-diacylglycerol--glycerol-3-phosphate 3-phosphatidyltransferase n=1 Tax=Bathycoccus prasinos TaxID=41875 RepID=K8F2X2_9CHLO|nr:CDP-diacylglycerol--glycerol-3-phosphate 3-phosphatidyltransferase [Bathycoccus prasinos]CCO66372.1 CDP-diacylglycerol--glycerol-3-phosphate 3-phosphatidyltransferase [Bathycoccus prasinos]|eukprot:XP_007512284.1 CDP-diacylglycerol--glycerol-3-phosphate 3-phosphatidyltransferase [Bathycoccus prasinos]
MAPSSRLTRTRSAQLASDVLAAGELDTIRALSPTRRGGGGGGGKITTTRTKTTRTKSSAAAGKEDEAARYGLTNSASGLTIPTMLTLARVAAIPAFAYMYYQTTAWSAPGCCFVFVLAAITDWLDGYLARKWNQSSAFGAFLDPVADKLMVACALVLLCSLEPKGVSHPYLVAVPSAIIIGREITMSALREWASAKGGDAHKAVKVNNLGKWKTATQMVAISVLLLVRDGAPKAIESFLPKMLASELTNVGVVTLWVSAALAALSLYVYMAPVLKYMLE